MFSYWKNPRVLWWQSSYPDIIQWTLLTFVFACMPLDVKGAEPLDSVLRAFRASSEQLKSGAGNGVYRVSRATDGQPLKLTTEADIEFFFDEGMYHIFLLYKQEPRGTHSQRIVYNKSEIAATRFSDRISRTGAAD